MICDLAQYYHVMNYEELSPDIVAALLSGLPHDSRIYRKIRNEKYSLQENLLMRILDELQILVWLNTKDAKTGVNFPKSVYDSFHPSEKITSKDEPEQFESTADFDKAWQKKTRKKKA